MAFSDAEDAELLAATVRTAGATALGHFRGSLEVFRKADGSAVSSGDLATDAVLVETLGAARPAYGIMSEERADAIALGTRTFVIDPIDGTNAYIKNAADWSVVAAVIEDGRPVAAAVYEPVSDTLFVAARGGGALRDDKPIAVADAEMPRASVAMPMALFKRAFKGTPTKKGPYLTSLALRLTRVADGRFDGLVTRGGSHHWDLAAGDLIVQEAGGTLLGLDGHPPRYDTDDTRHPPIVAGPKGMVDALLPAVRRATAKPPSGET
ncbi:MAG: 3'(2'),5'-bisphosphate nucleotidase CysQ [Pseudomonadota bacterium]